MLPSLSVYPEANRESKTVYMPPSYPKMYPEAHPTITQPQRHVTESLKHLHSLEGIYKCVRGDVMPPRHCAQCLEGIVEIHDLVIIVRPPHNLCHV